ncbi:MAG: addiction module toxin RelE [Duncaniella sp.]|nr:addiction module toxin RelE [Duncaniella sp.]
MEIIATTAFIKSAKALSKKYRSFNSDYQNLLNELEKNPRSGVDLGDGYRKVRMSIAAKGKGKSGGCRVITLDLLEKNECLYLLYIYDKSEYDNVVLATIKAIAAEMGL